MLQVSHAHPQLSTYHVLKVPHDFNRVPFAPPGYQVTIFSPPETRTIWVTRKKDAWYFIPEYKQYRAWKSHIPSKGGYRTYSQAKVYPKHCKIPTETLMDTTKRIATTLTRAIHKTRKENQTIQGRHGEAFQKLAKIFFDTADQFPSTPTHKTQKSSILIAPTQIRLDARTHQCVTRLKTSGIIPVETEPPENIPLTQPS